VVKAAEGQAVVRLVLGDGLSIRAAAQALGMSPTTAWRRYWWVMDWTLPGFRGYQSGPLPPQRGTRACPRGRPWLPTLDGPDARPLPPKRTVHLDGEDLPDTLPDVDVDELLAVLAATDTDLENLDTA
jgi:hypothetical protein